MQLMIKFSINGREVSAKENQTVLQVARENGIRIPHLCYHPALKPSGACRLCGVEAVSSSGRQVVMLSCILKAKDGLKVKTESDMVTAAREKAFSRLLQMAPDSKRIRALADNYGVNVPPPPDGCIRCRLCIRVCSEIVRAGALKMQKTEDGPRVVPVPGHCIGCGTCANLCPCEVIHVEDHDRVRTVTLKGQIVGQLPLERCEGCGRQYAHHHFFKTCSRCLGR